MSQRARPHRQGARPELRRRPRLARRRRAPAHARRVPRARDRGVVRAPPHAGPHRHPRSRDRAPRAWRVDGRPDPRASHDPRRRGSTCRTAASHLPLQMAPAQESEWAPELEEFDGLLANLPILSDDGLVDAIDRLRSLERDVSCGAPLPARRDRPHRPPPRRAPQRPVARDARALGSSDGAPVGFVSICSGWQC